MRSGIVGSMTVPRLRRRYYNSAPIRLLPAGGPDRIPGRYSLQESLTSQGTVSGEKAFQLVRDRRLFGAQPRQPRVELVRRPPQRSLQRAVEIGADDLPATSVERGQASSNGRAIRLLPFGESRTLE